MVEPAKGQASPAYKADASGLVNEGGDGVDPVAMASRGPGNQDRKGPLAATQVKQAQIIRRHMVFRNQLDDAVRICPDLPEILQNAGQIGKEVRIHPVHGPDNTFFQ